MPVHEQRDLQMTSKRIAILRAKKEASKLHRKFSMRERIEVQGGRIDVFETIARCGVELLFKPLDGLLGAYLDYPVPGVLITTKRQLSVQRLTGAHELGHVQLKHKPSIDDELMLHRLTFKTRGSDELEEFEADSFAIEFLLPDWLIATKFSRYGWNKRRIIDPRVMYQLSLRVGVSYEALCRSLMRPGIGIINKSEVSKLLEVKPKDIKKELLRDYKPQNMWGDVWELTSKDEGTVIEGSWSDLFLFRLREHANSGFLWNFEQFNQSGFAIVRDERSAWSKQKIGGNVERSITVKSNQRQIGEIILAEKRPWLEKRDSENSLSRFKFSYDLRGPETEGWSNAERYRIGVIDG